MSNQKLGLVKISDYSDYKNIKQIFHVAIETNFINRHFILLNQSKLFYLFDSESTTDEPLVQFKTRNETFSNHIKTIVLPSLKTVLFVLHFLKQNKLVYFAMTSKKKETLFGKLKAFPLNTNCLQRTTITSFTADEKSFFVAFSNRNIVRYDYSLTSNSIQVLDQTDLIKPIKMLRRIFYKTPFAKRLFIASVKSVRFLVSFNTDLCVEIITVNGPKGGIKRVLKGLKAKGYGQLDPSKTKTFGIHEIKTNNRGEKNIANFVLHLGIKENTGNKNLLSFWEVSLTKTNSIALKQINEFFIEKIPHICSNLEINGLYFSTEKLFILGRKNNDFVLQSILFAEIDQTTSYKDAFKEDCSVQSISRSNDSMEKWVEAVLNELMNDLSCKEKTEFIKIACDIFILPFEEVLKTIKILLLKAKLSFENHRWDYIDKIQILNYLYKIFVQDDNKNQFLHDLVLKCKAIAINNNEKKMRILFEAQSENFIFLQDKKILCLTSQRNSERKPSEIVDGFLVNNELDNNNLGEYLSEYENLNFISKRLSEISDDLKFEKNEFKANLIISLLSRRKSEIKIVSSKITELINRIQSTTEFNENVNVSLLSNLLNNLSVVNRNIELLEVLGNFEINYGENESKSTNLIALFLKSNGNGIKNLCFYKKEKNEFIWNQSNIIRLFNAVKTYIQSEFSLKIFIESFVQKCHFGPLLSMVFKFILKLIQNENNNAKQLSLEIWELYENQPIIDKIDFTIDLNILRDRDVPNCSQNVEVMSSFDFWETLLDIFDKYSANKDDEIKMHYALQTIRFVRKDDLSDKKIKKIISNLVLFCIESKRFAIALQLSKDFISKAVKTKTATKLIESIYREKQLEILLTFSWGNIEKLIIKALENIAKNEDETIFKDRIQSNNKSNCLENIFGAFGVLVNYSIIKTRTDKVAKYLWEIFIKINQSKNFSVREKLKFITPVLFVLKQYTEKNKLEYLVDGNQKAFTPNHIIDKKKVDQTFMRILSRYVLDSHGCEIDTEDSNLIAHSLCNKGFVTLAFSLMETCEKDLSPLFIFLTLKCMDIQRYSFISKTNNSILVPTERAQLGYDIGTPYSRYSWSIMEALLEKFDTPERKYAQVVAEILLDVKNGGESHMNNLRRLEKARDNEETNPIPLESFQLYLKLESSQLKFLPEFLENMLIGKYCKRKKNQYDRKCFSDDANSVFLLKTLTNNNYFVQAAEMGIQLCQNERLKFLKKKEIWYPRELVLSLIKKINDHLMTGEKTMDASIFKRLQQNVSRLQREFFLCEQCGKEEKR